MSSTSPTPRPPSAVAATGATSVFIHIDLDVLDPADIAGVGEPVPFGVDAATLAAGIRAVTAEFALVGASIAGFSPSSPDAATDDLPTILRVIGALTAERPAPSADRTIL